MSKLAVKVKTEKVIKALEEALKSREKKFAENAKAEAEYEKAKEKYHADLIKLAKSPKAKITDANHYGHYSQRNKPEQEINLTIMVPTALVPKEPERKSLYTEYDYKREVEEINNAIRLLSMTDDEYVNASTMKSVSQYL